jgi:hypothetical protein
VLDLEAPDLEMRPRGRRRGGGFVPPPDDHGPYAISALDGAIATSSLDGSRATYTSTEPTP